MLEHRNHEPILTSYEDEDRDDKGPKRKKRIAVIATSAVALAGIVGGIFYGNSRKNETREVPPQPETTTSTSFTPPEKTSITPSSQAETPPAISSLETAPPSTTTTEAKKSFEAPSKLNAATVRFQLENGTIVTGAETLGKMLQIPKKPGMKNTDYGKELVKKVGILTNINTSPEAIAAYKGVKGGAFADGLEGVMEGYVNQGAAVDAFGEQGSAITEYASLVNSYNREQAEKTGKDYGCTYVITKMSDPTELLPDDPYKGQVDIETREKCGEMKDGTLVKTVRERNVTFNVIPHFNAKQKTLEVADGAMVKTSR